VSRFRFKVCRTCKAEKPLRQFYRHPTYADGYMSDCKACRKAYAREMHWLKRESILARQKRYYVANLSRERERRAAYQRSERGKQVKREVYRFARYGAAA
jgi:ribosomal protein L40E